MISDNPDRQERKKDAILFFGTPAFAVPALKNLVREGYNIAGVITAPAKPIGRHRKPIKSPIQVIAEKHNLPLRTPTSLKDKKFIAWMTAQKPKLAIIAAYGKILPADLLDIPTLGFLNIHPSLLPRHRGPAPIVHTILSGDNKMGVTLIKLDAKMDHGPIIAQESWPTPPLASAATLTPKLARAGADLLIKSLPPYLAGKIDLKEQDDASATTHHLLKREDGQIDWQKKADLIERQIRAYDPWPGAFTCFRNERLKILAADIPNSATARISSDKAISPGQIVIRDHNILVMTGQNFLRIKNLQLAGQKKLTARDFINGHPDLNGTLLNRCPKPNTPQ